MGRAAALQQSDEIAAETVLHGAKMGEEKTTVHLMHIHLDPFKGISEGALAFTWPSRRGRQRAGRRPARGRARIAAAIDASDIRVA